jgi:hypothetical protein
MADSDALTGKEYAALVLLLAAGIIAAGLFVSWAYEQRGMLAPGTTLRPSEGLPADGDSP